MQTKFDFELGKAAEEINKRNCKKVLIQLPEGMKIYTLEIVNYLKKNTKAEIIVSGKSNWGGCDLAVNEAENIAADLILHFGHTQFIKTDFPVIYIEVKDNTDPKELLKNSLQELNEFKKIGIATSIQHIHKLEEIKEFYEKNNKEILISNKKGFISYPGQLIGCDYISLKLLNSKVDCFVIIGNKFHALGAALSLTKPVILLDVYNNKVVNMLELKNKIIKQRAIAINKIKSARNIGLIFSTKPGQKFGSYENIKKKLENSGKNITIISMNEISPDKLENFNSIDGFIEFACPRIATDDYIKYPKPLINYREALVLINELKWEDLLEKGFL